MSRIPLNLYLLRHLELNHPIQFLLNYSLTNLIYQLDIKNAYFHYLFLLFFLFLYIFNLFNAFLFEKEKYYNLFTSK